MRRSGNSPVISLALRLLFVAPLAVAALVGLVSVGTLIFTRFGLPDESRRASEATIAPGVHELRVTYGAFGLPDEIELRLVGAAPTDSAHRFQTEMNRDSADVLSLDRVVCGDGDDVCRAGLVANTYELTVVNPSPGEAAVVFEAIVRDDEGIDSTDNIRLDVVERVSPGG